MPHGMMVSGGVGKKGTASKGKIYSQAKQLNTSAFRRLGQPLLPLLSTRHDVCAFKARTETVQA